jgi:hypothetical protein
MEFERHCSQFLTGLEQQETESSGYAGSIGLNQSYGIIAPMSKSGLIEPPHGFNVELYSPRTFSCFDRLTGSKPAGNTEHLWTTQNQAPFDPKNVPQHPALRDSLRGFSAVYPIETDEPEACKHSELSKTQGTTVPDQVMAQTQNLPAPWEDCPPIWLLPSTSHNFFTQQNRKCFAVDYVSFLESSFGWPSESPENRLPEQFLSSLASNSDCNKSEAITIGLCQEGAGPNLSCSNWTESGPSVIKLPRTTYMNASVLREVQPSRYT